MTARELIAGLIVALAALVPSAVAARDQSPTEILAQPERFNEQNVVIAGTVSNVRELVSARGNPYFIFDVDDGLRALSVVQFGTSGCEAGHHAIVEGQFLKVRRQGSETFWNQVRAYRVTCR